MGSLLILRPGHARLPDLLPLPDGRFRLTVYQKLPAAHYVPPAYGTLYDDTLTGDELARYSGLRLINFDPGNERYKPSVPSVTLVYEQLHATNETQVGGLTTVTDENGREVIQAQFLQFSSAPYVKGTVGTTTPPGVTTAVLDGESATDEGILRKITRKYVQAGATFESVGEDEIDYELNGLKRRVRNLVAQGGVAFSGTIGTSTHPTDTGLVLAGLSIRESAATTKVKATYIQPGTLTVGKRSLNEGVVQYSYTFLGTEGSVIGTVMSRSIGDYQGLRTFNVTTAANKDGGSLVGTGGAEKLAFSFPKLVPFVSPGVVDIEEMRTAASVGLFGNLSAPTEFLVEARIYVYYQTSDSLVPGDYTKHGSEGLWNPSSWATKTASITAGVSDAGQADPGYLNSQALRGFRVSDRVELRGTSLTYSQMGVLVNPNVVRLDEVPNLLVNGRAAYRGEILHTIDALNTAQFLGGPAIYRSGMQVLGTTSMEVSWSGTAWVFKWSRTVTDAVATTGSGDNLYVFKGSTDSWVDSYTNQAGTTAWATLHTATGDTPTPFTATWPAGVVIQAPSTTQEVVLTGSKVDATWSIGAIGSWIEGRQVPRLGIGRYRLSGGPPNPYGRTFTLGVDFKRALEDVDGNQIYQKTITVATVVPAGL